MKVHWFLIRFLTSNSDVCSDVNCASGIPQNAGVCPGILLPRVLDNQLAHRRSDPAGPYVISVRRPSVNHPVINCRLNNGVLARSASQTHRIRRTNGRVNRFEDVANVWRIGLYSFCKKVFYNQGFCIDVMLLFEH